MADHILQLLLQLTGTKYFLFSFTLLSNNVDAATRSKNIQENNYVLNTGYVDVLEMRSTLKEDRYDEIFQISSL